MFDSFLSTVRAQTTLFTEQCSASLNDLRSPNKTNPQAADIGGGRRFGSTGMSNVFQNSLGSLKRLVNNRNQSYDPIPKSQSSNTVCPSKQQQQQLKWPVLVNNERQWVSSSSLYTDSSSRPLRLANGASPEEESESDSDSETVFRNPAHDAKKEENDSEEESLVDRFDRVLATGKSNKQRRNDREEIRRRLAMGIESEDVVMDMKKPSLHTRLQSGMNLQICFMNETASDGSDSENQKENPINPSDHMAHDMLKSSSSGIPERDSYTSLPVSSKLNFCSQPQPATQKSAELDFFAQQAKLQVEARTALAQAKELARVQMQVERQQKKRSLISDLVRQSLEKLGFPFTWDCRRLSRQILTELNVAQLQVIVNDLHTQIEGLNEELVQMLLKRDDFHMEQDSMLVDIEDLTRYLTAKQSMSSSSSTTPSQESGPVSLPVQKSSLQSPKQRLRSFRISALRK